ncbi:putative bifunctional diguanylate cyclase/phosphodiesterase [Actinoplanes flavus]|uniref:Bifunctional diguanylate cyclase/phosphodiesterase n=1 Tax=Actinoplanes flavus TaxID=2820290 RepID=A0ABS3UFR6_9ACTN|nr:bifunctional diguanylate cyclase/phosphodiesterase [Actinoplanes flavus]MBO3737623.1 bifunctional diguanylate cyclase/phosphodiesterase [Actinoplanes flavus]
MRSARGASRWLVGLLAVALAGLSGSTVFGSRQQADIVAQLAADSASIDAYQQAAYLVRWEWALMQEVLRKPGGEGHRRLLDVYRQAQDAMEHMAAIDIQDQQLTDEIVQAHRGLNGEIATYLDLIDQGDPEAAEQRLDAVIAPTATRIMDTVLAEQEHHLAEHAGRQAHGQSESRQLLWGNGLAFVVTLLVLALFGWSARAHRRQVETMAATDPLTGLPNRTAFANRTRRALAEDTSHRRRAGEPRPGRATVLVVNLDGFRDVNEQLGHRVGDLLLTHVSRRLLVSVREHDFVARLGGDEFAVLLRDADPEIGEAIAARLTDAFDEPFVIDDLTVDLEVSVGAATARPGEDVPTLLRHADTAMSIAKQQRLGFRRFTTSTTEDSNARLTLLGDLRRALDHGGEISLHYQPKVDIGSGALVGVEALARWQHPTKGPISPGAFIPVLEATTLIHKFTHQVLTEALTQARIWLDAGYRVPVAVNISTRSLLDADFPDQVAALLREINVPGERLCIEVTEYSIMSDPNTAIEALHRIRRLGVKISVDDYGTGYSSMTYLRLLPLDELKIDRSFVQDMSTDRGNRALVASTVELGHNLGLTVVAEGIEDASTLAALSEIGCDFAQGFHLARPMPADAVTDALRRAYAPAA